jgi:subtilisin-like proprotein convertase family protein
MKKQIPLLFLACMVTFPAVAVVTSPTVENIFATIPDGNLNGIQSSLTLNGLPNNLTDVNVTLTISGGFNGDFYAYLFHNNTSAILLNRVGRSSTSNVGYADAGFGPDVSSTRFLFDDQASKDVHFYGNLGYTLNGNGQLTGQWQPDGRAIDPLSSGSVFSSASRSSLLNKFNGMDPNGTWTLFVADVSSGSEGTLVNWGLNITAVPEPSCVWLAVLALGLAWRSRPRRV